MGSGPHRRPHGLVEGQLGLASGGGERLQALGHAAGCLGGQAPPDHGIGGLARPLGQHCRVPLPHELAAHEP